MLAHKKILVGLDGSAASFAALGEAIELARQWGAELHSVSIIEIGNHSGAILPMSDEREWSDSPYGAHIRQAIEAARERGVSLQPHAIVGHEVKAISQFLADRDFDLLVIGDRGHTRLAPGVIGGTCFGLTQNAPCSVLVVKVRRRA